MDHTMFTCRSCLCSTNKTISLFQTYNNAYYLPLIIFHCTGVKVDKNDNLIGEICINCADQLVAIQRFRSMFIESDVKLRHQLFTVTAEKVITEENVLRINYRNKNGRNELRSKFTGLLKSRHQHIHNNNDKVFTGFVAEVEQTELIVVDDPFEQDTVQTSVTIVEEENGEVTIKGIDDGIVKDLLVHNVDDIDIAGYIDVDTSYDERIIFEGDDRHELDKKNIDEPEPILDDNDPKNALNCKICGKSFPTAQSRRVHAYVHNQRKYKCTLCSRILTTAGFLRVHMQYTHNIFLPKCGTSGSKEPINETDCFCDICKMYFCEDRIARHMRTHTTKPTRPKCPLCPLSFSCTKNVQRHFKRQHGNDQTDKVPQFVCSACNEAFHRAVELYEHTRIHDDECNETEDGYDLTCDLCSSACETYEGYARHMTNEHNQVRVQPYKCRICSLRNGSKTGLYMHINCHYNNASPSAAIQRNKSGSNGAIVVLEGDKPYSCSLCHYRFKTARRLEEHARTHSGEEPYTCVECPKRFKTRMTLSKHIKSRHSLVREWLCSICGKDFSTKAVLHEHILGMHTEERPFPCDHCDKSFTGMSRLREHLRVHTNERPYICDLCSKAFRSHTNLRHHKISMHSDERKHKCTICSKTFKFNSSLKTHLWTHSGDKKPYNCLTCNLGFMRLKKLKLHALTCNS